MIPIGEFDEGDPLGDFDDVWQGVGAEATKTERGGWGVAADMAAALAAGVGEGVLDGIHSPALVVEERVVEDAADREFRIVLDRVALEVLVTTVAVDEPFPVGIAPADPATQREPRGSGLDVERLVVLDRADRRLEVELFGRDLHRLMEIVEPCPGQKLPGLGQIAPGIGHRQREGLEPLRRFAPRQEKMVEDEENAPRIDATGEEDTERFARPHAVEPGGERLPEGLDVALADLVEIGAPAVALGGEKSAADGIRVGAADEGQFHEVMRRHHPGVGGMELVGEPFGLEPGVNRVDPVGDDEDRPGSLLGDEVAERPAE